MAETSKAPSISLGAVINLPRMPSLVRYYDAYSECTITIRSPATENVWVIHCNGTERLIDFCSIPEGARWIMRHVIVDALVEYAPNTVVSTFNDLAWLSERLGPQILLRPLELAPLDLRQFWFDFLLPELIEGRRPAAPLKIYLKYLCRNNVGQLTPGDVRFISRLPGPRKDLYASVRSNEVFLTELEQHTIVSHLDELAEAARMGSLSGNELRDGCLLVAAFQYAKRPIQLAKVRRDDVRIRSPIVEGDPIVHVRFLIEKQKDAKARIPVTLKIKREWAVLYVRYCEHFDSMGHGQRKHLFDLVAGETSAALKRILLSILNRSRSATDLRHTAAQRLVDRGASHCQSARNFDPVSASNFDPFARRGLRVALGSSELAGIAETRRARVA